MSTDLRLEEQATNFVTMRHIERVRNLINRCVVELLRRGELHDQSKLEPPEVEAFTQYTASLAGLTFGSPEYEAAKQAMRPALTHHYAKNRHHPEHHKRGIRDMNLIDLVEMMCDWHAAASRHSDGNIRKSIEINATRFGIPVELAEIFENTVDLLS